MYSIKIDAKPFVNLFRRVLLVMGIPTPERHSLAHRAYGYLGLLIFGVVNLIFFSTISDIITPLWTSLAFLCATIKSLHFYYHRAEAWALIGHLDTFYMENNLECALMAKYIRGMKYLSVVCSLITIAAMNLYALMMVLLNVEPVLAYPAWLPFLDWKNNARDYWIATVFTHVSVHYDVLLLLPIEFLMSFLMCIISLQIEIIGQRLAVIGFSAERTTANLHESTEKLIQCIRLHRDAFQFKHSVCNLFSLPWTIQLFCSTLVISAVVTEVTKGNYSLIILTNNFFAQIFIPCYFGMRISAKSEMLMSQVYSSNWTALALWPKHGKQYKYLMFVFMEHLKRENVVVIGMLLPVNLETFSAIVNLACRLFALLKNS